MLSQGASLQSVLRVIPFSKVKFHIGIIQSYIQTSNIELDGAIFLQHVPFYSKEQKIVTLFHFESIN